MENLLRDVRYGLRALIKRPGFTVVVILTLALGIGANATIFSFVNAVLLTPLPYKAPEQLVQLQPLRGSQAGKMSLLELVDLNEQATLFEGFASFRNTQYNVAEGGPPEALIASVNTFNLFSLLGVSPLHGETWPASHDRIRIFEVLISHRLWQQRYGGDPSIIGTNITLDAAPYTVLGVMPPGFNFPVQADIYRRTAPDDYNSREIRTSSVIARLKSGVSIEQGQYELDRLAEQFERDYPETNRGVRYKITPFQDYWLGNARPYLTLLLGAVIFVLAIACANVASLFLSRNLAREKEIAIRTALGAGRGRLVRMLLTESLIVAIIGGVVGLLISIWSVDLIAALIRIEMPSWVKLKMDMRVIGFTFTVSTLTGILAGLWPALQVSRSNLGETLKEGGRGSSSGKRRALAHRILVTSEVSLALVLLIGAGLMMKSFVRLQRVSVGFNADNLLTLQVDPPWSRYGVLDQTEPFYRRAIEEIERIPGVESATSNDALPLSSKEAQQKLNKMPVLVEGQSPVEQGNNPFVNFQQVSPNYFGVMGIPILQGRSFSDDDRNNTTFVAVVSEQFADYFWPGQYTIGKRLKLGKLGQNFKPNAGSETIEDLWLTIVGVAGDVKQEQVTGAAGLDVYVSNYQFFVPETFFIVRTRVAPRTVAKDVERAVWKVDPEQSVFDVQTMQERLLNTMWQQRLAGTLFVVFAAMAVTLAAIGLYGVISYSVAERTREMGIRIALGACGRDIIKMIVGDALKLTSLGVVLGLVAAFGFARLISSLIYDVSAADPTTFAGIPFIILFVALVASFVPARRAARVDPMVALRYE